MRPRGTRAPFLCVLFLLLDPLVHIQNTSNAVFFFSFGVGVEFVVKSLAFHLASLGSIPVPATVSLV